MGTIEDIQERINGRLTIDANLMEGGFSQDIIGSVSYELANIYDTELEDIANECFVSTATQMENLIKCGGDYGIVPRYASSAIVYLQITGNEGATVNSTVKAIYNNLVYSVLEYKVIDESGVVTVKSQCDTKGTVGNVPANTIVKFLTEYEGLKTVNNPAAAYDGFDDEDIEIYRQRILDYLAEDGANCNEAQYKEWALSVTGVQKAVIKSAEYVGAGNVGVYISAIDAVVSDELKQTVHDYIAEKQFINANVIVNSLNYVLMNIKAKVILKSGYTAENIEDEFKELYSDYLKTVDTTVSYFNSSNILFDCPGVDDVLEFSINNSGESIELNDIDYPVVGEVEVVIS